MYKWTWFTFIENFLCNCYVIFFALMKWYNMLFIATPTIFCTCSCGNVLAQFVLNILTTIILELFATINFAHYGNFATIMVHTEILCEKFDG